MLEWQVTPQYLRQQGDIFMRKFGARCACGLAVAVVTTPLLCATAAAEGPATASVSTQFVSGGASATASSVSLAFKEGNATIGFKFGAATALYRESYSSADAKPLDLEVLKTFFGEPSRCPGSTTPVPFPNESLPLELNSNSLQPSAGTMLEGQALFPGLFGAPSVGVAGSGSTLAMKSSAAVATTSNPTVDLLFLSMVNPSTKTEVALQGTVRTATGVSTAERLIVAGGLLTIERPTWTAVAKSGSVSLTEGSFTSTGGTLFGIPRTPAESMADLAGFAELLHSVLGFAGVTLEMPAVTIENKSVAVSPLRLHIVKPPIGASLLDPIMSAEFFGLPSLNSQITKALDEQSAENCDKKRVRQLVDLILKVVRGTGEAEIPFGGVSASTDDTAPPVFDSNFGLDPITTPTTSVAPVPATVAGSVAFSTPSPSSSRSSASTRTSSSLGSTSLEPTELPESASVEVPTPLEPEVADASGPKTAGVVSFAAPAADSTRVIPGRTGGAGTLVGIALVSLAAAGVAAEQLVKRSHRRRIPS